MVLVVATVLLYCSIMRSFSAQMETQNQEKERKRCVQINKCPAVYSLFNSQPLSPLTVEFFKSSNCEFDESSQLLCCVEPTTQVSDTSADDDHLNDTFDLTTHPKAKLLHLESCGLDSDRIWEGSITKLDEFPWLALLYLEREDDIDTYNCGGVLITKRYVLTVAHCLQLGTIRRVRLGEHTFNSDPDCEVDVFSGRMQCAPPAQDFGVEYTILHSSQEGPRPCHDIGLVRLDRDAELDPKYLMPICLPMHDVEIEQEHVLAGWGRSNWKDSKHHLNKVKADMPVVDLKGCIEKDKEIMCDLQYLLCTNGTQGKGSSNGDSGMPLMFWTNSINGKRRYSLAGITTSGNEISGFQLTFYINVFRQLPWILGRIDP